MVAQNQCGQLGIPSSPSELGKPRLHGGDVSSTVHIPVLGGWSFPGCVATAEPRLALQ